MNKTIKALAAFCASAMLLSTSAFAANTPAVSDVTDLAGFTVNFDANNKLTVTAPDDAIETEQMTLLVVDSAATTITESDIIYINQQPVEDGDFEAVGMISTWLTKEDAAGKVYNLKLGYYWDANGDETPDFAIATAVVTVSADAQTITIAYGNVNGDAGVNGSDASLILQKSVGAISGFVDGDGNTIPDQVGNVNGDAGVNGSDASLILQKSVGAISGFVDGDGNPLDTYVYTPEN